jgi:hypothetical protein
VNHRSAFCPRKAKTGSSGVQRSVMPGSTQPSQDMPVGVTVASFSQVTFTLWLSIRTISAGPRRSKVSVAFDV